MTPLLSLPEPALLVRSLLQRELEAGDPLQWYRALRSQGRKPLLLGGAGAHPDHQWSFVAADPDLELQVRQGKARLRDGTGPWHDVPAEPLPWLREVLDRDRMDVAEDVPFAGGWAGYFGHEALQLWEPTLPGPRDPELVQVWLRRYRTVLCFHASGRAVVFARAGSTEAAEELLDSLDDAGPLQPSSGPRPGPTDIRWRTSMDQDEYEAAVRQVRGLTLAGDLFQANVATRFSTACDRDPTDLYETLRQSNPSPWMGILESEAQAIVSGSPELLVATDGETVRSRPIAGTRPRAAEADADAALAAELLGDEKERAEHTMLVDLVRNDLAKVCLAGSVQVPEHMSIERYRHVMHLVSEVQGRKDADAHVLDCLGALFPGGTITGAPKHRACQRIFEAEPVDRGPYTGSMGYFSWDHRSAWNILIRTIVLRGGEAHVHAGSGIVADSDPAREWLEARSKARSFLQAILRSDDGGSRDRLGTVEVVGAWRAPPAPKVSGARVLVVDNYDSFTYNLVDHCAAMGAQVVVVRNDGDWRAALADLDATHVILSPGPGGPDEAGCSVEAVQELHGRLPILGVCLGHQVIARALGGHVSLGPAVHGKVADVERRGPSRILDAPDRFAATRYHSLRVPDIPAGFRATACLADGTVMAMEHRDAPTFGLQFHPESIGSPQGMAILAAFLTISPVVP